MATAVVSSDPRVVLWNVSWGTYERLLADLADSSAPRLTYDRGFLEVMSPTPEHEELNRSLALIVELVAAELNMRVGSSAPQRSGARIVTVDSSPIPAFPSKS